MILLSQLLVGVHNCAVRQWFLRNDFPFNPDKSEVVVLGSGYISSASVGRRASLRRRRREILRAEDQLTGRYHRRSLTVRRPRSVYSRHLAGGKFPPEM